MKDDRFDFVVYTPCHRFIQGETAQAFELAKMNNINFLWVPVVGDAMIGRARSLIASQFMRLRMAPYLIFVDSDIVFTPDDLKRLYGHLKAGYEYIGGLYTVKTAAHSAHFGFNGKSVIDGKVNEVKYLSCGFTGISRALLERMVKELELPLLHKGDAFECYPFFEGGQFQDDDVGWIYLSEDWDFTVKARKLGVKAYCDTGIRLGHIGTTLWTVEQLIMMERAKREATVVNMEMSGDPIVNFGEEATVLPVQQAETRFRSEPEGS